jgi:hypothetical protein
MTNAPSSPELHLPPTAHANVASLQIRITEMASTQSQLQDALDQQVQTTLNNEYKFARTQDLTLRQATAARSRDRARIEQLMKDKNDLTASQLVQGADELRATQQRILAHEAEADLLASQSAQHLRQMKTTLQASTERPAAYDLRLDQTHSAHHHAHTTNTQAQSTKYHDAHLHAISTAATTATLARETTYNRQLFEQLTAAADLAIRNANAANEAANTATTRAQLQATTLQEIKHNHTDAAVTAAAVFTATHQSLPSTPIWNDPTSTRSHHHPLAHIGTPRPSKRNETSPDSYGRQQGMTKHPPRTPQHKSKTQEHPAFPESSDSSDDGRGPTGERRPPNVSTDGFHHTTTRSQGVTTYTLLEKAEHLLAHVPTYSGQDGSSGIKFIAIADNYMQCNQETAHRMISAVTARFTPDSAASHWHKAQCKTARRPHWRGPSTPPSARRGFQDTMQGWYDFRSMFLDRFTPPHESVRIQNGLTSLVWKPAVISLNAHILIFATQIHFLDMLESPLSQQDQIIQFIRSLNSRQLATRVTFDMTLLEAIKAVQTRATTPFRHDFTPRNLGQSSRRLTAVLNELNLDKEEGNGDDEDLYYDAKDEDEENTLNATRRATSQGNRIDMYSRINQSRLNKENHGASKEERQSMTPKLLEWCHKRNINSWKASPKRVFTAQQHEWYRNKKCINCGQDGHFKRDCRDRSPTTHMGG